MDPRARYVAVLGCVLLLAACGGGDYAPFVRNPMIEKWCGAHPCEWTTHGETERVGTWHPDDYAIALVGDDASVSQLNTEVNEQSSRCFAFSLTADISAGTHVFLELDFSNDGEVDFHEELPELHWERKTFDLTTPTWYQGVRFSLRKEGPGRAVVAQLNVVNRGTGCSAPPIPATPRPVGASCASDDDCQMHRCVGNVCGGTCKSTSECAAGEVCGKLLGRNVMVDACTPLGSLRFGEVCSLDEQCESDACTLGVCSECVAGTLCDDGSACARSKLPLPAAWGDRGRPHQCGPGGQRNGSGELCTVPDDCESGTCEGASLNCALYACLTPQSSCAMQCLQALVVPGTCR